MGELASMSVFAATDKECDKCGMEKHSNDSKGCCKDVTVISVKSEDHHMASEILSDFGVFSFIIPPANSAPAFQSNPVSLKSPYTFYPPPGLKQPYFIQYSNFRI
jgi:hypothetical protein